MGLTIRDRLAALALRNMRSAITDDDEGGPQNGSQLGLLERLYRLRWLAAAADVKAGTRQLALAMLPKPRLAANLFRRPSQSWQCVALKRRAAVRHQLRQAVGAAEAAAGLAARRR